MSENLLPKSRLVEVTFSFVMPITATRDQVEEWVSFELGYSGAMEMDNPLDNFDLEALTEPVLRDSCRHLHEQIEQTGENTYTTHRSLSSEPSWGPNGNDQMREIAVAHFEKKRGASND